MIKTDVLTRKRSKKIKHTPKKCSKAKIKYANQKLYFFWWGCNFLAAQFTNGL